MTRTELGCKAFMRLMFWYLFYTMAIVLLVR